MSNRLDGYNPLSYLGVSSYTPPTFVAYNRAPTANDNSNFNLGTLWLYYGTEQVYILTSLVEGVAIWTRLYPQSNSVINYDGDTGTAQESGGTVNFYGDGHNISTVASGNTITTSLSNGSDGQLLIGGGSHADWANLTSTGNTVVITNGANSINLEVSSAQASSFVTDSGTAEPVGGALTVAGGSNINTSAPGSASTVEINLNDTISISGSATIGTGITVDSFSAGVVQSDASGVLSSSNGTDGQLLIGGGASPQWASLTAGANITITEGPNTIEIAASGGGGGGGGTGNGSAFLAIQENDVTLTGGPSLPPYVLGTQETLNILFDESSAVYAGNGLGSPATFTAPVTGKYYLGMQVRFRGANGTEVFKQAVIITPQRSYVGSSDNRGGSSSAGETANNCNVVADLNAGDVVTFQVAYTGTALVQGDIIKGGTEPHPVTWICGYLVGSGVALKPAFSAYLPSNQSISASTLTSYGAAVALTELYDVGSNFNPGDGAGTPASFTAPQTGNYFFTLTSDYSIAGDTVVQFNIYNEIVTPARTFTTYGALVRTSSTRNNSVSSTCCVNLTSGNVVYFKIYSDLAVTALGDATNPYTIISGYLIQ